MSFTIQIRRDTAANWTTGNPTPEQGEWCLETDTGKVKIGDGSTAWTSLDYFGGAVSSVNGSTGAVTITAASIDAVPTSDLPIAIASGGTGQTTAPEAMSALAPWVVFPSGDTTGATDPTKVQEALSAYNYAELVAGTYYANTQVTAHEAQFVRGPGIGAVNWNMVTAGITAFQWTPADSSNYNGSGTGGITGVTITNSTASAGNPTDGSVGLQMADIVHLECDVLINDCEYGFLASNQYYWTERANFTVRTYNCTNPVTFECATSGGDNRTGSFDRTWITWYANENMAYSGSTNTGLVNGLQVINGAQFEGGGIRIYGNIGGEGTTDFSVYALYVNGAANSSAATNYASIIASEVTLVIETAVTGTIPGTIYVGADCYIAAPTGQFYCYNFGAPVFVGTCQYFGSIYTGGGNTTNPYAAGTAFEAALWNVIAPPSGWGGAVRWKYLNAGTVIIDLAISIPASTTVSVGETIATLPGGAYYPNDSKYGVVTYTEYGYGYPNTAIVAVSGTGVLSFQTNATDGGVTTPSGGDGYLYGTFTIPVIVD